MKLKHLFFNALAVMAFAACSSEAEEIKPADKASTATLQLDMTGQYGTGNSDQTRALSLDGTEYPRFIHEEGVTNWSTHCFIRNEAGDVQFYALVDWNATTDSDGNISLHIKNSTLTLQNSAGSDVTATETLPKAGERWYIAGIAGGGVLNETKSNVSFAYNATLDGNLKSNQARIPLAFGWTRFTIPSNTERAPRIVVQFKPQGTLLHVYVNNKTNASITPQGTIKFKSTAIERNGVFDFSDLSAEVKAGGGINWVKNSDATGETTCHFLIRKDATSSFLVWGMPTGESSPSSDIVSEYYRFKDEDADVLTPRTTVYEAGKAYLLYYDVYRPKMHLEYFAEHNVAADGESFNTTDAAENTLFASFETATTAFAAKTIGGKTYHLPSNREIAALAAGSRINLTTATADQAVGYDAHVARSGGTAHAHTALYRNVGGGVSYSIRLGGYANNIGDIMLTAFRYRLAEKNGVQGIEITCRYVGADFMADELQVIKDNGGTSSDLEKALLDKVSVDEFWAANTLDDMATRFFPLTGYKNTTGTLVQTNRIYHWANFVNPSNADQGLFFAYNGTNLTLNYIGKTNLLPLRLLANE